MLTIQLATLATILARRIPLLAPIWSLLPARFRWVPSALLAACGVVAKFVVNAPEPVGALLVAEQSIDVLVAVGLAWSAGYHAPDASTPPAPPADGGKVAAVITTTVLGFFLLLATGCAGSFETARLAGIHDRLRVIPIENRAYCRSIDSHHATWAGIAAGSAAVSGASGVSTLPVPGDGAKAALAGASLGFAALAVVAKVESDAAAVAWARECGDAR